MALIRTDYGLIYNTDGSLCATLLPEGGVAVTEWTTNLCNPSFIYKNTWTTIDYAWNRRTIIDCAAGDVFTISADIRNLSQGEDRRWAQVAFHDSGGIRLEFYNAMGSGMSEQRSSFTTPPAPVGTVEARVYWVSDDGFSYQGKNFQIEKKPYATPFVDGTRADGVLDYPIQLSGDFTIAFYWWVPISQLGNKDRSVLALSNGTNVLNFFQGWTSDWYLGDETKRARFRLADFAPAAYTIYHIVLRRQGEVVSVFRDGALWDTVDFGAAPNFTTLRLGGLSPQSNLPNSVYDELLILPYAVSPETIATWHSLDAPFYDPREQIDAGARPIYAPGVQIDSTGAWGISNGVKQAGFGTDGKLVAGGGSVVADADGLIGKDPDTDEVKFKIGTNGKVEVLEIYSDMYKEIRNVLPYTGQDSLDADKPIVIPFYIPSETTKIVAAFLSAEARRYRAYAKSAPYDPDAFWLKQTKGISFNSPAVSVVLDKSNAATGSTSLDHYHQYSDTHIVSSASGGHSHPLNTAAWPKLYTDYTNPGDDHNHLHTLDSLVIPSDSGTHTHSTTSTTKNTGGSQRSGILGPNDLSHSHTYERVVGAQLNNFNNHFHDFDPAHDHKLEFGIHEDTTPANVRIRINNGSGWSEYISLAPAPSDNAAYDLIAGASVPKHNNNASEMDLTPYLSGTGWKHIEFSSSRLGLIAWNIILKLDITA